MSRCVQLIIQVVACKHSCLRPIDLWTLSLRYENDYVIPLDTPLTTEGLSTTKIILKLIDLIAIQKARFEPFSDCCAHITWLNLIATLSYGYIESGWLSSYLLQQ